MTGVQTCALPIYLYTVVRARIMEHYVLHVSSPNDDDDDDDSILKDDTRVLPLNLRVYSTLIRVFIEKLELFLLE